MKFDDIKTDNGGLNNPCTLVSNYLMHEEDGGTLATYIEGFEFESREEVEKAIRKFIRIVSLDQYMRRPHLAEANPFAAAVHTRYNKIFTDESKLGKVPVTMSGDIWHGGFSRRRLEARTRALFDGVAPKPEKFAAACKKIQDVYGLSEIEVERCTFRGAGQGWRDVPE